MNGCVSLRGRILFYQDTRSLVQIIHCDLPQLPNSDTQVLDFVELQVLYYTDTFTSYILKIIKFSTTFQ